jgi:hypothetical protein
MRMLRSTQGARMQRSADATLWLGVLVACITATAAQARPEALAMNFGTARALRTCPDRTQPSQGPIGVAQATAYVACNYEDRPPEGAAVTFVDVVELQIAPNTRPVNTGDIVRWPQIDPKKPIFVLRGSVVTHTCWNISRSIQAGANCTRKEVPNAVGTCWQNQFAAWSCYLRGQTTKETRLQPAPSK